MMDLTHKLVASQWKGPMYSEYTQYSQTILAICTWVRKSGTGEGGVIQRADSENSETMLMS